MKKFSRRDILKTSVLASAAATMHGVRPIAAAMDISPDAAEPFFAPPLRDSDEQAMKRAGTTEEPKLRDAIAATRDHEGITGKISLDAQRNS